MQPAAVLAAVVKIQGITPANKSLGKLQGNLVATDRAAAAAGGSLARSGAKAEAIGRGMSRVGSSINRNVGLPFIAVSALSAKAAMDFESSFAEVRKTVDATEPQFAKFEKRFRKLALQIPISVNELNKLGGMAGALGIKQKALLDFVKTAAELGTTTDLSSEEAANALARIANVMGTSEKDFRRLASTFVDLGNKGASTEKEIAEMSLRLTGAGKQVGLTEAQVLSFSSALASVGIRAQAGGSAFSKVFSEMAVEVKSSGKLLETYGKVAGMSSQEFADAFEGNATGAMIKFIEGLDRIRKNGGNVYGVLKKLELNDIRVRDALLRAAGAGKLFREQIATGNKEWKNNNALTAEAEKRYKTTASKVKIAGNELYDLGITVGQNLLPVIVDVAKIFGDVIGIFAALPPETQELALKVGVLVTALGILLSIGGKLFQAYAQIPKLITWLTTAQAANTVATQAQAAANAELAASATAAATAQRSLLIANKSGAVVGSVPVGGAVANTTVGTAAGATGAQRLASGLAKALPFALAAAGIANIVSSSVQGDMEQAGFKSGGALVGGIAGALLGKSPAAAALGAGLGSFVGGMVGDLFGGEAEDSVAKWEQKVKESMGKVADSSKAAKSAFREISHAQRHLSKIGQIQGGVAKTISRVENRLASLRKNKKAGAPEISRAEERLHRLKQKSVVLTRRQWHWERALGNARNTEKRNLRGLREAEVGTVRAKRQGVESARQQVKQAEKTWSAHAQEGKSLKVINEDLSRLSNKRKKAQAAAQSLREWEKRLGQTMGEISDKYGPKYANHLRQTIPLWTRNKEQIKSSQHFMKQITPTITPISKQMKDFGNKNKSSTDKTQSGFAALWKAIVRFGNKNQSELKRARKDIGAWKGASVQGVSIVESKLGGFAKELGITNVGFGVKQGGKKTKKQKGGIVVPGVGAGDKVPMTAWVEPGEVVHVLNKRAAGGREKLASLEQANKQHRRFQSGGTMINPGWDPGNQLINRAISGVVGNWATRYRADMTAGYDPGGGHISSGHNVTGTATDMVPREGWPLGTKLFEGGLRAIQGQVSQLLYGSHGIGTSYPNHGWGNHAHIEWGMHPTIQGLLGAMIPKILMTGPEGALKKVGQGTLDSAVAMANKRLQQLGGIGGGADTGDFRIKGSLNKAQLASLWRRTNPGNGSPGLMAAIALAESGGDPRAINSIGAKGLYQIIPSTAAAFNLGYGQLFDPTYNTMGAGRILSGQGLGAWEAYTNGTYRQFLQRGGTLGGEFLGPLAKGGTGKNKGSIASGISNVLKGIEQGKHLPKYRGLSRKLGRRIEGIGLDPRRSNWLALQTSKIEEFAENASNASSQTSSIEVDDPDHPGEKIEQIIQGVFKGGTEADWLQKQLTELLSLRKGVIGSHSAITELKLPQVKGLIDISRKRLKLVKQAIKKAERKKRRIEARIKNKEKKIDEIEKASKQSEHRLKKQLKDLEHKLDSALKQDPKPAQYIGDLRGAIHATKIGLSDNDNRARREVKKTNKEIHRMKKHVKGIEGQQVKRNRVKDELEQNILPKLTERREGMVDTARSLFGSGATIGEGEKSIMGLEQIQGVGGGTNLDIGNPPAFGSAGGEIFNVQSRMEAIKAEMERKPLSEPSETTAEQLQKEIAKQINEIKLAEQMEWKQRFISSQLQSKVIKDFPTVPDLAKIPGYALGGSVMPIEVGERGRELLMAPLGSRMVSHRQATQAAQGHQSGGPLVIESLVINEADGTAVATVGGKNEEAKIKNVTRKQARSAIASTPGGTNK